MEERKREYSLDFLKIAATVCIVFHHYQQVTDAVFSRGINFWNGKFYFGFLVELFFVLSGYFISSYAEKIENGMPFGSFYLKRLLRLFPLLAVGAVSYEILLMVYFRVYKSAWVGISTTFWGIITDSLGVQEGWSFQNPCVNNPTWYISVLMLCYALFYFAVYLAKRCKLNVNYLFAAIVFIGAGIYTAGISLPFFNASTARGYYAFFFGILFAKLINKHDIINAKTVIASYITVALIILLIYFKPSFMESGINYTLTFLCYPAMIIIFKSKPLGTLFNRKFFGVIGKISFDVYIWHSPLLILLYIVKKTLIPAINLSSIYTMLGFCIACYIVGALSHFFIEKPAAKLIKKLMNKKS